MDWELVIERNGKALRRIVAVIAAIAGLRSTSPLAAGRGATAEGCERPLNGPFEQPSARSDSGGPGLARRGEAEALAEPGEGHLRFLPRHLHRAVLRMIRPAEAAARRLVIVAARDIRITLPPLPPAEPVSRPPAVVVRKLHVVPAIQPRPQGKTMSLPLLDPLPRARPPREPSAVRTCGVPRILFPGVSEPRPIRPWQAPSPDDPIDATRIALRLAALARALSDLPAHARRFARWRARRDRALAARRRHRTTPIRANRPRGIRSLDPRVADLTEVVLDLHYFAREALHDTS